MLTSNTRINTPIEIHFKSTITLVLSLVTPTTEPRHYSEQPTLRALPLLATATPSIKCRIIANQQLSQ